MDSYSLSCRYALVKEPDTFQRGTRKRERGMAAFRLPRSVHGGADGIRTHALLVANQALSQLSYGPRRNRNSESGTPRRPEAPAGFPLRFPISDFRFRMVGPGGFEPPTSPLSGARSSRLSYEPCHFGLEISDFGLQAKACRRPALLAGQFEFPNLKSEMEKGRAQFEPVQSGSALTITRPRGARPRVLPRKEVIQPQVPLRLPCYDLVPVTRLTVGASLPEGLGQRLRVLPASVA